jgi:hypothetical protein
LFFGYIVIALLTEALLIFLAFYGNNLVVTHFWVAIEFVLLSLFLISIKHNRKPYYYFASIIFILICFSEFMFADFSKYNTHVLTISTVSLFLLSIITIYEIRFESANKWRLIIVLGIILYTGGSALVFSFYNNFTLSATTIIHSTSNILSNIFFTIGLIIYGHK